MSHRPPAPAEQSRRRYGLRLAAILALIAPVALISSSPATAAISTPGQGAVVSGKVVITEARGAKDNCLLEPSGLTSRIEVIREADGAVVHDKVNDDKGSWETTWNSVGQPMGAYRVKSFAKDGKKSGFFGCKMQSEAELSNFLITLQNRAGVSLSMPTTNVTGEDLSITVTTHVVGNGVSGQALANRDVRLDVPGVGDVDLTTDAGGAASTVVELSDLPAQAFTVTAEVLSDSFFEGESGSATTQLTKRTTETAYRGQSRVQPGHNARLEGQVLDATPGSDRYGQAVPGVQLALSLDADSAEVTTTSSGKALRSVPVAGPERTIKARAEFAGTDVWQQSRDEITFFVGEEAATQAPVQNGVIGGVTSGLGGLLGSLLNSTGVTQIVTGVTDLIGGLLNIPTGALELTEVTDLLDRGLLHLLDSTQLHGVLTTLLGGSGNMVSGVGAPVDEVLNQLLAGLAGDNQLGELVDTATFTWRGVAIGEDGTPRAREFDGLIGVPEPIDITGDGRADVLASLTLANNQLNLSTGNVGPILDAPGGGDPTIIPRLEIARLPGAPAELPLSLQAILTLPGGDEEYRFGYDTRDGNAPDGFRADIVVGDDGVGLQVRSNGDDALTVTGALVPAATPETDLPDTSGDPDVALVPGATGPREQRFGISFEHAPEEARIAFNLGSGSSQDIAATLTTESANKVTLKLVDDSGADEVFLADAVIDSVDGNLGLVVSGDESDGMAVDLSSDKPLAAMNVRAKSLDAGRVVSDIRLGLTDVPEAISFGLDGDGQGELTASGPIGIFEAGYATGREIAVLNDPAYLNLISEGDQQSISLRLPGFEAMSLSLEGETSLELSMAPTPLRAVVSQDGLELDASIEDAPRTVGLSLSANGGVEISGSDPIALVTITAHDDEGIFSGATDLDLRLEDVPSLLSVSLEDGGAVFETGGDPVGLVELYADSGVPLVLPVGDSIQIRQEPSQMALAARISGLRKIGADFGTTPDILLDTVAGEVFDISMQEVDGAGAVTSNINATLDHLVPGLRLRLVDDGNGATSLKYEASEPTNSLSFDFDGMAGSISGPLPTAMDICMASDEACLPELGIEDPGLGSIRFAASEHTTLNLVDPGSGINVSDLRLRALELTGDLDTDNGGDVYLNTTEFGGECGATGCVQPIEGGRIDANLDGASLRFEPGNGFYANDAITNLEVDKLFGQAVGVSATGGTGEVHCVSATKLDVTVDVVGIPITLSLKSAICNVTRS